MSRVNCNWCEEKVVSEVLLNISTESVAYPGILFGGEFNKFS